MATFDRRIFPVAILAGLLFPPGALAAEKGELDTTGAMLQSATGAADWLVTLPFVIPLIGSALALALRGRIAFQSWVALLSMGLATIAAVAVFAKVLADGPQVMAVGNWLPPFGILIAVDALGALFVLITTLVGLVGLGYARADTDQGSIQYGFFTFYQLMIAGVCGAFSTGDIFNLYVWFEVFLLSSFGLIVMGSTAIQLDGGVKYGLLNLVATTVFLIAVGLLYGLTGTLNMADIGQVLAAQPSGPLLTLCALFVLAFAMKAAVFPLHFWLPASYHTPAVIVSALFAGLLTKVGIYSLMRVVVMLFGAEFVHFSALLIVLGTATGVVGALGALAQSDLRRMTAFLVVSGIGAMIVGIGFGTVAGLTGAIVYAVHSIIAMTALFVLVGTMESATGVRTLNDGGGLYTAFPLAAALGLGVILAVAGLPPFSGFWPKFLLLDAAFQRGDGLAILGAVGVLLTAVLTTIVLGRAWVLTVLRPAGDVTPPAATSGDEMSGKMGTLALLVMLLLGLGLFPSLVIPAAEVGAEGLLDPALYTQRVLSVE